MIEKMNLFAANGRVETAAFTPPSPIVMPKAFIPRTAMERRDIQMENGERQFHVQMIREPEDWPEAHDFVIQYDMPMPGTMQSMRFPLRGISLKRYEMIEDHYPIPPQIDPTQPIDLMAVQARAKALNAKYMALIEEAVGKLIPGTTPEDKMLWFSARGVGDIESLVNHIYNTVGGNKQSPASDMYRQAISSGKQSVIEFNDFADWKTATETNYVFHMVRPFQDTIMEISLKGISAQAKEIIEEETREKPAPLAAAPLPGGGFDGRNLIPDYQNPHWKKSQRACMQKRTVLYLDQCLPFKLPGSTHMEKYDWLSRRLMGDVINLRNFMDRELLSYRERFDFL